MTALRVATLAATGALLTWALETVVIGVAGGPGRSPLTDPLHLLGLGLLAIAVAAVAVDLSAGRPPALRAAAAGGGLLAGAAAAWLALTVVGSLVPAGTGWVGREVGALAVALIAVAGLGAWLVSRERGGYRSQTGRPSPPRSTGSSQVSAR